MKIGAEFLRHPKHYFFKEQLHIHVLTPNAGPLTAAKVICLTKYNPQTLLRLAAR